MALASLYARELNCLRDTQKAIRLPALQKLHSELLRQPLPDAQVFFSHHLKPTLFSLLSDPVDKCRELSVSLLSQLNSSLPDFSTDVIDTIEALGRRLTAVPVAEAVEEIRLAEVRLIKDCVRKWWEVLAPIVTELGAIVAKALQDPFPQIKHVSDRQESADLLEVMCRDTGLRIGLCAPAMCAGALDNLAHQHSKVRTTTLHALGTLFAKTGNCELLKTLYPVLKQKLRYDRTAAVRSTLFEVVRNWLVSFAYESLMYETDLEGRATPARTETQLTYLLLSGVGDNDKGIAEKVIEHLAAAGDRRKTLAREFSEDLQADMESAQFQVMHMLPDLVRMGIADSTEWTVNEQSKTRGAIVILAIAKLCGSHFTPHLDTVFKTAVKCYSETEDQDQKRVYEELIETIAKGCQTEVVVSGLTKYLAADQSSPSQRVSVLVSHNVGFFEEKRRFNTSRAHHPQSRPTDFEATGM